MIYVSRFIDVSLGIDEKNIPIAISDSPPPWWKEKHYICYPYLAPGSEDKEAYKFKLYSFKPTEIVNKLLRLSHNKDMILAFYENWQLNAVKDWLMENGYECERYKKK